MKYIDIKDIKKGTANTVLGLNDADEAVLSEINIDLSEYVTEDELALKGYVNTEDLDRALAEKQDRLVSGENIATINGNSLLDGGNIEITIPSDYVTENELNNTLNQKDYATKTYVDNAIENIEGGNVDLSDYYTKGEVDNLIDNVEVDLNGYATEQWVDNKGYLTAVPSEYVTETELTNKGYATTTYVDTQIGDINTILENIIG